MSSSLGVQTPRDCAASEAKYQREARMTNNQEVSSNWHHIYVAFRRITDYACSVRRVSEAPVGIWRDLYFVSNKGMAHIQG
jgi:hypothetical protein